MLLMQRRRGGNRSMNVMMLSSQLLFLSTIMMMMTTTTTFAFTTTTINPITSTRSSTKHNNNVLFVSNTNNNNNNNNNNIQTESIIERSTKTNTNNNKVSEQIAIVFGRKQPIDEKTKKFNKELIHNLKSYLFDVLYTGTSIDRSYARFYALETIARMPYFSYLSVLHLLETLGMWRKATLLKVHFAESWNELHHLLIMEDLLNNNLQWKDRFIAQHIAFFYYWIIVLLYMTNPSMAYNLNQNVEEEAYETYNNFIINNKQYLQTQPAPKIAKKYYSNEELYMFNSMHTDTLEKEYYETNNNDASSTNQQEHRRPTINTLYDTFIAIRDDEMEHAKTMEYLQHKAEE